MVRHSNCDATGNGMASSRPGISDPSTGKLKDGTSPPAACFEKLNKVKLKTCPPLYTLVACKPARTSFYHWQNQFKLYIEGFGFPNFLNFAEISPENLIRLDARAQPIPLYVGAPPISELLEPSGTELQRHVLLYSKRYCWSIPMPSIEEIQAFSPVQVLFQFQALGSILLKVYSAQRLCAKLPSRQAAKLNCIRTYFIIDESTFFSRMVLLHHWRRASCSQKCDTSSTRTHQCLHSPRRRALSSSSRLSPENLGNPVRQGTGGSLLDY